MHEMMHDNLPFVFIQCIWALKQMTQGKKPELNWVHNDINTNSFLTNGKLLSENRVQLINFSIAELLPNRKISQTVNSVMIYTAPEIFIDK